MEMNDDYSAKIIGEDKEHFLTYSLTLIGRYVENSNSLSEDVRGKKFNLIL